MIAIESELQARHLKGVMVLQPVTRRSAPNDHLQKIADAPSLAWRVEHGLVLHIGEYSAFTHQTPPTVAMDLDPVFTALGALWEAGPFQSKDISYLDLLDLRSPDENRAFFYKDAIHYEDAGSPLIGHLLTGCAMRALNP